MAKFAVAFALLGVTFTYMAVSLVRAYRGR